MDIHLPLTSSQCDVLLIQLRRAIEQAEREGAAKSLGLSPDSLERIRPHLDKVIEIVRRSSADHIEPFLSQMMDDICEKCPAQEPSGFCPLRRSGGCILFRDPRLVIDVIDQYLHETSSAAAMESPAVIEPDEASSRKDNVMFARILVAVDDSAPALVAVKGAAELAVKLGATVSLLNVVQPPVPLMMGDNLVWNTDLPAGRAEPGRALLKNLRAGMPQSLNVEEVVLEGPPADVIVAQARAWKADLIVIGTHSRHGVSRFILGSTAEAVARRAECAVLVARGDKPGAVAGGENTTGARIAVDAS